jgi:hypothetical protein
MEIHHNWAKRRRKAHEMTQPKAKQRKKRKKPTPRIKLGPTHLGNMV